MNYKLSKWISIGVLISSIAILLGFDIGMGLEDKIFNFVQLKYLIAGGLGFVWYTIASIIKA